MAILSFVGGVFIGMRKVHSKYPEATLFHVECRIREGEQGPVDSAYEISRLAASYRSGGEEEGLIEISTTKDWWSSWTEPVFTAGPVHGPGTIPFPPTNDDWEVELEGAVERLHEHQHAPTKFWSCQFFGAMGPPERGLEQPLFAFTMSDDSIWYVGAKDGRVWPAHESS